MISVQDPKSHAADAGIDQDPQVVERQGRIWRRRGDYWKSLLSFKKVLEREGEEIEEFQVTEDTRRDAARRFRDKQK